MLVVGSVLLALLAANLVYALSLMPITQNAEFLQDNYYLVMEPSFFMACAAALGLIVSGVWVLRRSAEGA